MARFSENLHPLVSKTARAGHMIEAPLIRLTRVRLLLWGIKSIGKGGTGGVWLPQVPEVYDVKFLVGQ